MAKTRELSRRIRSVQNAGQITKALEVVAASRMRRIQDSVARVKHYADLADSIMRRISPSQEAMQHPYFKESNGNTNLYITFNSDRGQVGAFNSNIFHLAHESFMKDQSNRQKSSVISFGRKGTKHFANLAEIEFSGAYEDIADSPDINVFAPILDTIREGILNQQLRSVQLIYTEFKSSLQQTPVQVQLLPISTNNETSHDDEGQNKDLVYEFEPSIENVLEESLRLYLEARLMAARIQSATSEHAQRMIAMGNANRNAKDLIDALTLELNSVRQAAITQEIAEITGGAEAIAA